MALTDTAVRQAKATGKAYTLGDMDGLSDELPELLHAIEKYQGAYQTRLGLRLLLLTGVRTCELRLATPDQFDLERELWIIPPGNVKQLQHRIRKSRKGEDRPAFYPSDGSCPQLEFLEFHQRHADVSAVVALRPGVAGFRIGQGRYLP
jgi:hypothetical protein